MLNENDASPTRPRRGLTARSAMPRAPPELSKQSLSDTQSAATVGAAAAQSGAVMFNADALSSNNNNKAPSVNIIFEFDIFLKGKVENFNFEFFFFEL